MKQDILHIWDNYTVTQWNWYGPDWMKKGTAEPSGLKCSIKVLKDLHEGVSSSRNI
jgi:hypothetical protein